MEYAKTSIVVAALAISNDPTTTPVDYLLVKYPPEAVATEAPSIWRRFDIRPIPSASRPGENNLSFLRPSDFYVVLESYARLAEHLT